MGYKVITFNELNQDYVGKEIHFRTASKGLAVVHVVSIEKGVDTVNITYQFISGDTDKFKTAGATAVAARSKNNWGNPAKFWLPYVQVASSRYDLPENNDGQDKCRFCGAVTRRCGGWSSMKDYRVCTQCGR